MLVLKFIITIIAFSFVQMSNAVEDFIPTSEFIDAAEEYVRLNLVEELNDAQKMFESPSGLKWLHSWQIKRNSILIKAFVFPNPTTGFHEWFHNWRERLQRFQELQNEYLQTIVNEYFLFDKSNKKSIWPRVTFDPEQFHTFLHSDESKRLKYLPKSVDVNPIALEEDILHVLRFHQPISETEQTEKPTDQSLNRKTPKEPWVDKDALNKNTNVKKYHVINKEKIKKLVIARYILLRESLRGKRMSDLDYQKKLFQIERISAQLDLLKFRKINHKLTVVRRHYMSRIEYYLKLISDDFLYRKYLNFDDTFFQGNIFYGFNNRYDDPVKHGLDFDVTAKRIIGQPFSALHEISNQINEFGVLSKGFIKYNLEDLPMIDLTLERFKMMTFWYPRHRIIPKQWFVVSTSESRGDFFVIKPFNGKSLDEMFENVFKLLNEAKNQPVGKSKTFSMFESSENFHRELFFDSKILNIKNIFHPGSSSNVWTRRVVHYMDSLDKANLLPYLTSKSITKQKTFLKKQQPSYKKISNIKEQQKDMTTNKLATQAKDFFDTNSNPLMQQTVQESIQDYNIKSNIGLNGNQNSPKSNIGGDVDDVFRGFDIHSHSSDAGGTSSTFYKYKHH